MLVQCSLANFNIVVNLIWITSFFFSFILVAASSALAISPCFASISALVIYFRDTSPCPAGSFPCRLRLPPFALLLRDFSRLAIHTFRPEWWSQFLAFPRANTGIRLHFYLDALLSLVFGAEATWLLVRHLTPLMCLWAVLYGSGHVVSILQLKSVTQINDSEASTMPR